MSTVNSCGLRRDIPAATKREIRQRCGFGCVVCGNPIVTYHHFDPPFHDAREHAPEGITILCGCHHIEATSGMLAADTVRYHNDKPYCHLGGYTRHYLKANAPVMFQMGPRGFHTQVALMYEEEELIVCRPPEVDGGPWLFSAKILDENGMELLTVQDNEWLIGIDRYDIRARGKSIEVRAGKGDVIMRMDIEMDKRVHIRKLQMECLGVTLSCDEQSFCVSARNGASANMPGEYGFYADVGVHIVPSQNRVKLAAMRNGSAAIALYMP